MKNNLLLIILLIYSISGHAQVSQERYNILWFSCEDIGPCLGTYGTKTIETPNIDRLAKEGLQFNKAYATVGVCAPSRSSIITGMYPISIGSMHMRTGNHRIYRAPEDETYETYYGVSDMLGRSIPQYATVPPPYVKCFTEYLREAGYYCTNNAKCDYQFNCPISAWDEVGNKAHYNNRENNQPFFSVWNFDITHESQIWRQKNKPLSVDPNEISIPNYYPDIEIVRQDVARKYSNIETLDAQIGAWIEKLESEGLLDKTIIFFWSDHGGPLLRQKRAATNSGLQVPLIVRFPDKRMAGKKVDEIVSLMDLGPTVLSLAGIKPPSYMHGQAIFGKNNKINTRKYAFGSADRFDEHTDRVRSVNNGQYVYVRNFIIDQPYTYRLKYREQIDMTKELIQSCLNNELHGDAAYIFADEREREELYDLQSDPYEVHNLADDPQYEGVLDELRMAMGEWQLHVGDKGLIPEYDLVNMMWPGMRQPRTAKVEFVKGDTSELIMTCQTEGASIAYQMSEHLDTNKWNLYFKPIKLKKGQKIRACAIRLGYKQSKIAEYTFD